MVHRSLAASQGVKDLALQAITEGIPTDLIDSDAAVPRSTASFRRMLCIELQPGGGVRQKILNMSYGRWLAPSTPAGPC